MQACDRRSLGAKGLALVVVASIICSGVTVAAYDLFFAQKIVAVDLASSIAFQRKRYAAGEITADELVKSIEGLAAQMRRRGRNEVLVLEETVAGDVKRRELGAQESDDE